MKWPLPVALALLGAGCGSAAPGIASRPGVAGGKTLTFAWPVPSRAWVTVTAVDKGGTGVARFEMIVGRDVASGKISVAFAHVSLVSAPGLDVKDPASRGKVRRAEALAAMLPLLVAPDGRSAEAVGFDELAARLPAMVSDEPDEQASVAALVKDGRAVLAARAAESWGAWVATWLTSGLREGATVRLAERVRLPDGSTTDIPVVYTWVGPDKAIAGAVDLRLESVIEGAAGAQSFRRERRVAVVTDPSTMRLTSASTEETTSLARKGQAAETIHEKRTYRFDWEL